jgi:hypothetical protein
MGKFTEEDINRILNLKSADGTPINVFDLHGILFIGNCRSGIVILEHGKLKQVYGWDLAKTHTKYNEHSLPITIDDFELCETEEDVEDTFAKILEEVVTEKLI